MVNGYTADDPKVIIEKAQEATRVQGVEAVATLVITDPKGRERIRRTAQISKLTDGGKTEKKLIRFLSPADVKGTGFLMFDYENKDDDMWLFMPALRKTRRIISSEKSKSFMGSEFSYADMTFPNIDDFKYKLLSDETVNKEPCQVIEITPVNDDKADEYGYSKKVSYIAPKDYVIRKAVYYDLDKSLHKEMMVNSVKEIDTKNHKYRITGMEIVNKQNNRKSKMTVDKITFLPNAPDKYFTTAYLEKQ
ncbi:MAG: outer membrane lipoprotein-sorting protein [Oligoflexia bacterium]|nr:outer membrane lipoprotein-sorting protein [Oligoflexia bacterium]